MLVDDDGNLQTFPLPSMPVANQFRFPLFLEVFLEWQLQNFGQSLCQTLNQSTGLPTDFIADSNLTLTAQFQR